MQETSSFDGDNKLLFMENASNVQNNINLTVITW